MKVVATMNVDGFLSLSTARATEPRSACHAIDAAVVATAAAPAAAPAFSAPRRSLRKRTARATTTRARPPIAATTSALEDNQRGMWNSQRVTSFESSVLPIGSVQMRPITVAISASANNARSKSAGRRTLSKGFDRRWPRFISTFDASSAPRCPISTCRALTPERIHIPNAYPTAQADDAMLRGCRPSTR